MQSHTNGDEKEESISPGIAYSIAKLIGGGEGCMICSSSPFLSTRTVIAKTAYKSVPGSIKTLVARGSITTWGMIITFTLLASGELVNEPLSSRSLWCLGTMAASVRHIPPF